MLSSRYRRGAFVGTFLSAFAFAQTPSDVLGSPGPVSGELMARPPEAHVSTDARQRQMALENDAIREALQRPLVDFAVADVPLEQALATLLERTKVRNWHVRWQSLTDGGVARDKRISMKLHQSFGWRGLTLLLEEAGGPDAHLAYEAIDGVLVVSTEEDLYRRMEVRVYPIGDLLTGDLARMRQRLAALREKKAYASDTVSASAAAEAHYRAALERIKSVEITSVATDDEQDQQDDRSIGTMMMLTITIITQSVEPDSWIANGGIGTVQAYVDSIVVRNNVNAHRMVTRLLNDLRAADIANADRRLVRGSAQP